MILYETPDPAKWPELWRRPSATAGDLAADVRAIMQEVREGGDEAILRYSELFDGVRPPSLRVATRDMDKALDTLDPSLRAAMETAMGTIGAFHRAQRRAPLSLETVPGVTCRLEYRPIDAVGLYVPGGSAPLPSTVLMLAVPAMEAGCGTVVLCSPPYANGLPHPSVMAAARLCGITHMIAAGGAQAVAAMAYGTASVPRVRKIVGPGNAWVTTAKQLAALDGTAMDLPAGPSEVLVLCDASANAREVAADLIAQAEHGTDSQVVLVSTCHSLALEVMDEVRRQVADLPRRTIAEVSLNNSLVVTFKGMDEAVAFTNGYAPEHLIVVTDNDEHLCSRIRNAGSIFLGRWTPESLGDYASGTNHTLPTGGWAGGVGGVTLDTFHTSVTVQHATARGLARLRDTVVVLARAEGLEGHARSVLIRQDAQDSDTGSTIRTSPILLDANENAVGSPFADDAHRYPDAEQMELRQALACLYGTTPDRILPGNGSDELIDTLIRVLCEPYTSNIVVPQPSFMMVARSAATNRVATRNVMSRTDFRVVADDVLGAITADTRLVMLCSPNNPTGRTIDRAEVEHILQATEDTGITVVIDEAYVEFAPERSLLPLACSHPRCVVLRTMSKAWGLASLRCGALVGDPALVGRLRDGMAPYNISTATQRRVVEAIRMRGAWMLDAVRTIVEERERMITALRKLPIVTEVVPGEANFLLVRMRNVAAVLAAFEAAAIVVRDRSEEPGCAGCMRITIGTADENAAVLDVLRGMKEST